MLRIYLTNFTSNVVANFTGEIPRKERKVIQKDARESELFKYILLYVFIIFFNLFVLCFSFYTSCLTASAGLSFKAFLAGNTEANIAVIITNEPIRK